MVDTNGSSALCKTISGFRQIDLAQDSPSKTAHKALLIRTIDRLLEYKAKDQLILRDRGLKEFPLQTAARVGFVDAIKRILDEGVDINSCSDGIKTPLYHAAAGCHLDAVKLLLEHKAIILPPRLWSRPPRASGWVSTPFYGVLICKDRVKVYDIVKCLLDADDGKERIEQDAGFGQTPLLVAPEYGDLRCCQLLIQYGASVHTTAATGYYGYNLLHAIAKNGWDRYLEQIIQGFSIEELEMTYRDKTPEKIVKDLGHERIVQLLKRHFHQLKHSDDKKSGLWASFRSGLGKD